MSRPMKKRNICSLPRNNRYGPLGLNLDKKNSLIMTVDEYETIRLIDKEDFTQAECAEQMNIARTTVQGIYVAARRKLAESLVDGKILVIEGGKYQICDGLGQGCGRRSCHRHQHGRKYNHRNNNIKKADQMISQEKRMEKSMKIAIPVNEENLETDVSLSFGRATYYLIYDLDTKKANFIENSAASSKGGAGIKAAQIIVDNQASVLITPRCGINAVQVLEAANIKLYQTEFSLAKENIDAYKEGKLSLLSAIHPGHHGGH